MPTSKTSPYDVIIVGAGVNGCASAWFLRRAGLKVALIDQEGIAAGGSGAAGAFIAPKISKSGPLKDLMDKAHARAMAFYPKYFPEATLERPLFHIAKTPEDADKLRVFRERTDLELSEPPQKLTKMLNVDVSDENAVYFDHSAVVNAQELCRAMSEGVDFYRRKAESPIHDGECWETAGVRGKYLLVAIGAYPKLLELPYIQMRGIWGHRIDITSDTKLSCILHHYVSVSPTSKEGVMAIGATHNVHYSPFGTDEPYDITAGRIELIEKAGRTLKLDNIKIIADYTGLRSGSNDYLPILGPLVDTDATLKQGNEGEAGLVYYPDVFMINGSGGYGFVLAPYLAEILADHLHDGKKIDSELLPERFFKRWLKKNQS